MFSFSGTSAPKINVSIAPILTVIKYISLISHGFISDDIVLMGHSWQHYTVQQLVPHQHCYSDRVAPLFTVFSLTLCLLLHSLHIHAHTIHIHSMCRHGLNRFRTILKCFFVKEKLRS